MPVNAELAELLDQYSGLLRGMGVPLPEGLGASEDQILSELEPVFGSEVPDDLLTWFLWTSTLGIDEEIVSGDLIPYMTVATTTTAKRAYDLAQWVFTEVQEHENMPAEMKSWLPLNSDEDTLAVAKHTKPLAPADGWDGCYRVCNDWFLHRYRAEDGFFLLETTNTEKTRPDAEIPPVTLTQWVTALVAAAPDYYYKLKSSGRNYVTQKTFSDEWPWAVPLTGLDKK